MVLCYCLFDPLLLAAVPADALFPLELLCFWISWDEFEFWTMLWLPWFMLMLVDKTLLSRCCCWVVFKEFDIWFFGATLDVGSRRLGYEIFWLVNLWSLLVSSSLLDYELFYLPYDYPKCYCSDWTGLTLVLLDLGCGWVLSFNSLLLVVFKKLFIFVCGICGKLLFLALYGCMFNLWTWGASSLSIVFFIELDFAEVMFGIFVFYVVTFDINLSFWAARYWFYLFCSLNTFSLLASNALY